MSLDQAPDDIIRQVLYYVSPEDNLSSFQLLSHRLNRLANDTVLWKYYCQTSYRYWSSEHELHRKLKERASAVGWKKLFLLRKTRNAQTSQLLDEILASKVGRLRRIEQICQLGYDVKEFLLEQCHADDSREDVLARRYYGNSILDALHRSVAIETWYQMLIEIGPSSNHSPRGSLERALGAFDLFVLHDEPGDLDEIGYILDEMTIEFRKSNPSVDAMTTRQKALAINQWLRSNDLTGLREQERNYRNLRNCYIGQALRHPDHESIPIISSTIFCCIAERLGLEAQCCSFPTHVHAVVLAQEGMTLDDKPNSHVTRPRERMYLDPYGSDDEVPLEKLQALLAQFRWQANTDLFLAPVSPPSIAMRTARNIRVTASRAFELRDNDSSELTQLISGNGPMNMEAALYSALWAALLMTPADAFAWDENLEPFLRHFAKGWHEDAWLVEKYLMPLYDRFAPLRDGLPRNGPQGWDDPREILSLVREMDEQSPPVFRRPTERGQPARYKIGQVFRHRRYRWIGVINGWTDQGTRRLPMPHTVAIGETLEDSSDTELPNPMRPRNQTFYTCLRRTTGIERHVVAEDNIILMQDVEEVPRDMFALAGKFFKRFDEQTCSFVSNLKEQYPDD